VPIVKLLAVYTSLAGTNIPIRFLLNVISVLFFWYGVKYFYIPVKREVKLMLGLQVAERTIKETSKCVRPERINKWSNSMMMVMMRTEDKRMWTD